MDPLILARLVRNEQIPGLARTTSAGLGAEEQQDPALLPDGALRSPVWVNAGVGMPATSGAPAQRTSADSTRPTTPSSFMRPSSLRR